MTSIYAIWVDGTNVCAQREGYFISKAMTGRGAIFQSHTLAGADGEWFQWSIPTPVIIAGKRAKVKKIFVFYETEGTAKLMKVHIYDMATRIATFENLNLSGKHFAQVEDTKNAWLVQPAHPMLFGLGISVLVNFGPPSKLGVPKITFFTAGADFEV